MTVRAGKYSGLKQNVRSHVMTYYLSLRDASLCRRLYMQHARQAFSLGTSAHINGKTH